MKKIVLIIFPGILFILVIYYMFINFGSVFTEKDTVFAATTPSLGEAAGYGILASTYTDTSAATTVNGSVGFTTPPASFIAGIHTNYGVGAPYSTAGTDQGSALSSLASQSCTFTFAPGVIDLSTDATHPGTVGTFTPGVYCSTGAMNISGALTLSGSGTYIFRAVGALNSAAGAVITLTGASACDIFWTPTQATTLGANTIFAGNVIDDSGITVGANSTWTGRALAFGGTITTDTDTITVPTCLATLNVVKTVVNNSGGTAVSSSFNLHVKSSGVDVSGSPAVGMSAGRSYSLSAGTYVVSEDVNSSYASSFSGDCDSSGNITLSAGQSKTCTITNDDIAISPTSTINVVKTVTNDNGGTKVVADFPLFVNGGLVTSGATNTFAPGIYTVTETADSTYASTFSGDCTSNGSITLGVGDSKFCIINNNDIPQTSGSGSIKTVPPLIDVVKVPSPLALPNGVGPVTYTYTLRNIGTVPVNELKMIGDTCSPIVLSSGDINGNSVLDLTETWIYTCSTTLSQTHTNTVVTTGTANGVTVSDIASSTVVVGTPLVAPLIHVTKIPSSLLLSINGGVVTYTEKITNPGAVALNNVRLTDDKCSPMNYVSGDTNNDSKLDTTETWTYTCQTNLYQTTTNTAIATGEANGFSVRDIAIATVVVAPPALPKTGFPPKDVE